MKIMLSSDRIYKHTCFFIINENLSTVSIHKATSYRRKGLLIKTRSIQFERIKFRLKTANLFLSLSIENTNHTGQK